MTAKNNFDIKGICIIFHGPLSYAIRHIRETFIKRSKRTKVQINPLNVKLNPMICVIYLLTATG